ncbi:MAG: hypothetical protein Q7R96_02825 [Nanoarchaeota archaeon]|nr:hypothetical protein [Nanoarchaeota archaeon]
MHPDTLNSLYIEAATAQDHNKLDAEIALAIAELETAYTIASYEQQLRIASPKKKKTLEQDLYSIYNDSLIETSYKPLYEKKQETMAQQEETQRARQIAWRKANSGIGKIAINHFTQTLQQLRQDKTKDDKKTLEQLLAVTHDLARNSPTALISFAETLPQVPQEGQSVFMDITQELFEQAFFSDNQLLRKFHTIAPKTNLESIFTFEPSFGSLSYPFCEKLSAQAYSDTKSKTYKNDTFDHTDEREDSYNERIIERKIRKRDFEKRFQEDSFIRNDSSPTIPIQSLINDPYCLSTIPSEIHPPTTDTNFFAQLHLLYRSVGTATTHAWMEYTKKLLTQDKKGERKNKETGRAFIKLSPETLSNYFHNFHWDFATFIQDYEAIGPALHQVGDIITKYSRIDEYKAITRHLIDTKDTTTLEQLANQPLDTQAVEHLQKCLPKEISVPELITAINATGELYRLCINNNINQQFITNRLARQQQTTLETYLANLELLKEKTTHYVRFVQQQRQNPAINMGFDESRTQTTLNFYEEIGKNFDHFEHDFKTVGKDLQKLAELKAYYQELLPKEQFEAFARYIIKQRSRDLINELLPRNVPDDLISLLLSRLEKHPGKENLTKALVALSRTYSLLTDVSKAENIFDTAKTTLQNELTELPSNAGYTAVVDTLTTLKKKYYAPLTQGQPVPTTLEPLIDPLVIGYHKNTGGAETPIRPTLTLLVSTYLKEGATKTRQALDALPGNKKLLKNLKRNGIDVTTYRTGIQKVYTVGTDEQSLQRLEERVNTEMAQAFQRLEYLELEEEIVQTLHEGTKKEQLEHLEKLLAEYQSDEQTKPFCEEIRGHIQKARSIHGTIKDTQTTATFYVSQDPIESLHMGQFFGSCLSLAKNHGGCNGWAAVVQTVDANKNVIYARTKEGQYIGRNRTALTDQGILCTRFYQNGSMNLDHAWIDYLQAYGEHTQQEIMLPAIFVTPSMRKVLEKNIEQGTVHLEERTVTIQPGHYAAFYGDGVPTSKETNRGIEITTQVYVLAQKTLLPPIPERSFLQQTMNYFVPSMS